MPEQTRPRRPETFEHRQSFFAHDDRHAAKSRIGRLPLVSFLPRRNNGHSSSSLYGCTIAPNSNVRNWSAFITNCHPERREGSGPLPATAILVMRAKIQVPRFASG